MIVSPIRCPDEIIQYTYALLLRLDRDLHSSTRQASNTSNNKAATNQIPSHLSHHHPSPMITTADPQRPSPSRPLSPHHLSNIEGPIRRWAVVTKSNTWFDGESTARLQTFRARNPTMRDTGTGCPRAQLPEIFVSPPEESTHRLKRSAYGQGPTLRRGFSVQAGTICNVHSFVRLDRC